MTELTKTEQVNLVDDIVSAWAIQNLKETEKGALPGHIKKKWLEFNYKFDVYTWLYKDKKTGHRYDIYVKHIGHSGLNSTGHKLPDEVLISWELRD